MTWHPTCHEIALDKLENDGQPVMKWHPIS